MPKRSIHPPASVETLHAHLERLAEVRAFSDTVSAQVACVAAYTGDLDRFSSHDPASCADCRSNDGAQVHHARTDAEIARVESTRRLAAVLVSLFVSAWGVDGLPLLSAEIERKAMDAMRLDRESQE